MAQQSTQNGGGTVPWRSAATALAGIGAGGAGAFSITNATSEQIAWGAAAWSLMTVAAIVTYLARTWVERRFVHVEELIQARKDADLYLGKWVEAEQRASEAIRLVKKEPPG